jgi:hypothetical protein
VNAGLFEELHPVGFAVAYRMLGSVSEAEDIVQEAFLCIHITLADGGRIESPRAYLARWSPGYTTAPAAGSSPSPRGDCTPRVMDNPWPTHGQGREDEGAAGRTAGERAPNGADDGIRTRDPRLGKGPPTVQQRPPAVILAGR